MRYTSHYKSAWKARLFLSVHRMCPLEGLSPHSSPFWCTSKPQCTFPKPVTCIRRYIAATHTCILWSHVFPRNFYSLSTGYTITTASKSIDTITKTVSSCVVLISLARCSMIIHDKTMYTQPTYLKTRATQYLSTQCVLALLLANVVPIRSYNIH